MSTLSEVHSMEIVDSGHEPSTPSANGSPDSPYWEMERIVAHYLDENGDILYEVKWKNWDR
jgi:hypothetical protein